jgi:hypothetical protein
VHARAAAGRRAAHSDAIVPGEATARALDIGLGGEIALVTQGAGTNLDLTAGIQDARGSRGSQFDRFHNVVYFQFQRSF